MDPVQIAYVEQDDDRLQIYTDLTLSQISLTAKQSYTELTISSSNFNQPELNFQQNLHIELLIDNTRQKLLICNLALTEYIGLCIHERESHLMGAFKTQIKQEISLSCLKKQEKIDVGQVGCIVLGDIDKQLKKKQKLKWTNKFRNALQSFKKILTIRQVQLTMVLFILEHRKFQNFPALYMKNFSQVMQFMIPLQETSNPINIFILQDLFKKQTEYLRFYHEEIQLIQDHQQYLSIEDYDSLQQYQLNNILSKIKIANSKIKTISEIFPQACVTDLNDLFSVNQLHPRWQQLLNKGYINYIALKDQLTLQKSFLQVKQNINVVNAAMSIIDRHKSEKNQPLSQRMMNIYQASVKVIKCALNKSQAHFQAECLISEPKDALTKQIWNLPENKKFRQFIRLSLPSIQYSQVLYLPRIFKQYFKNKFNQNKQIQMSSFIIDHPQIYANQLFLKKTYQQSIRIRINSPYRIDRKINNPLSKDIAETRPKNQSSFANFSLGVNNLISGMTKMFKQAPQTTKQLIFHIHGGGFISMSSFIHQTYTRIWSNNLNIPIISVDYGKAPDRPFPEGLYDCLQAYLWTLLIFKQIFQASPQKIVLVGDSAGGNLVAALTTLLIEWNLPIPTGICLVYPALNLNQNNYTPSLLTALNDMILPHTFLKICAKAYLINSSKDYSKSSFVHPILTKEQTLCKYPRTQIFVGNKDPFHDDCCRFVEKLNWVQPGKAKLTILDQFPHGFLQFDLKLMPNQYSRQATKLVEQALSSLLKDQ